MTINRNLSLLAESAGAQNKPTLNLANLGEVTTVVASAATGTINFDVLTQSVLYYTANASANWTLNVRGDGTSAFSSFISVGQSVDIKFFVTNGATAYVPSAFQIDGSAVTVNWAGGSAPTSGTANAIDEYSYTIICTAAGVYTVFGQKASQTSSPSSTQFGDFNFLGPTIFPQRFSSQMFGATSPSGLTVIIGNAAAGDALLNGTAAYLTSTNGTTWTTAANFNGYTATFVVSSIVCSSSGRFVVVGYDASDAPMFTTSTDGSTWTTPTRMNGSAAVAQMHDIAVNSSGRFVAVGYDSVNAGVHATSTNGTTWTTPSRFNFSTSLMSRPYIAVNAAGQFVVVGLGSGVNAIRSSVSADGLTWTTPAVISSSGTPSKIAVNSSGRYVVVGATTTSSFFITSTDGTTWTSAAPIGSGGVIPSWGPSGLAVNASGKFMAVGGGSSAGVIYSTSSDGTNWTPVMWANNAATFVFRPSVTSTSTGSFIACGYAPSSNYPYYAIGQ